MFFITIALIMLKSKVLDLLVRGSTIGMVLRLIVPPGVRKSCLVRVHICIRKVGDGTIWNWLSAPTRSYFSGRSFTSVFYYNVNCKRLSNFRCYWVWIDGLYSNPRPLIQPKVSPLLIQLGLHSTPLHIEYTGGYAGQYSGTNGSPGLFSSQCKWGISRIRLISRAARQRALRMLEPPSARIRL